MLPATEPRQACSINCSSSTASPRLEIGPPDELETLGDTDTGSRTDTAIPGIKFAGTFGFSPPRRFKVSAVRCEITSKDNGSVIRGCAAPRRSLSSVLLVLNGNA